MVSNVKITIPCKLGWTKLKGYDNSGNKNSTIELSVEVSRSINISSIDFTHTVSERSREEANKFEAKTSVKATYSVVEASVSAGVENSSVMKDLLSSTKDITRKQDLTRTDVTKESFSIGPGDQLYLYQRVFKGPGLSCALDVTEVSSAPDLEARWTDVDMAVTARPLRFVKTMDVAYGGGEGEAPDEYVREVAGKSADVNDDQTGDFVWMVPVWTYESDEAATGLEIRIQGSSMSGWKDLASGAGGDFRYVYANHNEDSTQRVVDARLIRSGDKLSAEKQVDMLHGLGKGWVGGTRDINDNRGGSFLYLAYKLF